MWVKRLLQNMRRKKAEEFSLRFTYERKHESIIRPIRIGIGLFIFINITAFVKWWLFLRGI
jgi:hypothetical protein